jgi:hypothetical protein
MPPAVSTERFSLTTQGNIRYRLKTPYRDGTTDVVFEPLDFMARLAALVPSPRVAGNVGGHRDRELQVRLVEQRAKKRVGHAAPRYQKKRGDGRSTVAP